MKFVEYVGYGQEWKIGVSVRVSERFWPVMILWLRCVPY